MDCLHVSEPGIFQRIRPSTKDLVESCVSTHATMTPEELLDRLKISPYPEREPVPSNDPRLMEASKGGVSLPQRTGYGEPCYGPTKNIDGQRLCRSCLTMR